MGDKSGGPGPPITMDTGNVQISSQQTNEIVNYDFDNKYQATDKGPFFVYIEHKTKNLGRLFPVKVGHFLQKINEFKKDIIDIKSLGLKRVKVIFKTYKIANALVQHEVIIKNDLVAFIPNFYTKKRGIVRMVDTFFSEDYLKTAIISDRNVVDVKRLKRKTFNSENNQYEYADRQMIMVTFLGNEIPKEVIINLVRFPVDPYIHPVVQCFRCLRYGHTSSQCKSKDKCQKCSEEHTVETSCNKIFCIHCKSENHSSISKDCPMYKKQYNIKKIMAYQNKSFKEAEIISDNPSYAKALTTNNRFDILNTLDNFPNLSNPSNIPIIRKPLVQHNLNTNKPPPTKKRKALSPPQSPPPNMAYSQKSQLSHPSQPIIPNPYREEFQQYKEKMIFQLTELITRILNTDVSEMPNINIKDQINSIVSENLNYSTNQLEASDCTIISDDDESTF